MTSSESEGQTRSRKRSRTSEDGGKEGKKARGRPRVDTQDATAADRRRTQIRLAQRAYRQRKETTISSLKNQSTQLHSIIEQMNKTFLRLNDSTLKSGLLQLNPTLTRELKHATEVFTSLTKAASELEVGEDENGEGVEQAEHARSAERSQAAASPAAEALEIGWGYSAVSDRTDKTSQHIPIQTQPENYFQNLNGAFTQAQNSSLVPRRQYTVGEIWDQSRNSSQHQPTSTNSVSEEPLPFGLVDMLNQRGSFPSDPQIFQVDIPTPGFTPPSTRLPTPPLLIPSLTNKTIAPVFTYSHDETTFARRLTRAALEAGFHMLSSANTRPSALNYVFKLSLPYASVDDLRIRFKMMLSRSVNEDLEFWETPFIHLGGAGTHYPRKDRHGNAMPRKNSWTVRQIGPLEKRMVRAENVSDGQWQYLTDIDLSGFEGEWFDAYDVQGYLEERWGCRLDPKSSFAECLVEDESQEQDSDLGGRRSSGNGSEPGLTRSESSGSTEGESITTPDTTTTYPLPDAPYGLDMSFTQPSYPTNPIDLSFDQTLGLDLAPGYDYGFSSNRGLGADMALLLNMPGEVEVLPRQLKKRIAWIEVNPLIDELIKHGVCLGRAPGFRRKDVDMAVQKALVSIS